MSAGSTFVRLGTAIHKPALWCVLLVLAVGTAAQACEASLRVEDIKVPDGDAPMLEGGVWYRMAPSGTAPRPLIVISHGGGGSFEGHEDTAKALACAGFVVAAVTHAGDSFRDQSRVLELWRRPLQLQRLITFMLTTWHLHALVDARQIGAFGFSNGGFTILVAIGGTPDLDLTAPYCATHETHSLCASLAKAKIDPHLGAVASAGGWAHDSRIRAAVIAAPAFGFAFGDDGLKDVKIPVQLWGGTRDERQPAPWYEDAVYQGLSRAPDFHRVPEAGHYDFLPPCGASLAKAAPAICVSRRGFDRAAFHRGMNEQIVVFFDKHLRTAPSQRH